MSPSHAPRESRESREIRLGDRRVGDGHPVYVVADVGINHNGDLRAALALIDEAANAGCDAVKLQKRTPALSVPARRRAERRHTPWGEMSYLEYRERLELSADDYAAIARHCRARGVAWFASCWDAPSVDVVDAFDPPCHELAAASFADRALLARLHETGRPLILSTGMSTMADVRGGVALLAGRPALLVHTTSVRPCPVDELNLRVIPALRAEFPHPVGYAGHDAGATAAAAVALGACFVECRVTLDRGLWGNDHAASTEPAGLGRLVRHVRATERALGDGVKRIYESEQRALARLAGVEPALAGSSF